MRSASDVATTLPGYWEEVGRKRKEARESQPEVSPLGCGVCNDLGWIRPDIKDPHAKGFGLLIPCSACGIVQAKRQERLEEISGLSESERRISISDFVSRCQDTPGMIEIVQEYAAAPCGFLTLWGGPGNGKTLALMALANHFRQLGALSIYVTFVDLLDYMRAGFDRDADEDARQRYETIKGAYFLAVDEIDKANMTQYAEEFRTRFLDDRYRLGIEREAHTAFAMNRSPEFVMPSHLYSRLRDGRFTCYKNQDPDMRPALSFDEGENSRRDWVQETFG